MSTQKRLFTAMTPSFCSLTDTKQSLQYTIKTHLSGPPMPKFEANMNYIPPSPPSSIKQCNKSATVKFHMELLLTTMTRKQSRSGATPIDAPASSLFVRKLSAQHVKLQSVELALGFKLRYKLYLDRNLRIVNLR